MFLQRAAIMLVTDLGVTVLKQLSTISSWTTLARSGSLHFCYVFS